MPHPLSNDLLVRIQTNGSKTPHEAFKEAITKLNRDVIDIKDAFTLALKAKNARSF